jgi:hypothetical protein
MDGSFPLYLQKKLGQEPVFDKGRIVKNIGLFNAWAQNHGMRLSPQTGKGNV